MAGSLNQAIPVQGDSKTPEAQTNAPAFERERFFSKPMCLPALRLNNAAIIRGTKYEILR